MGQACTAANEHVRCVSAVGVPCSCSCSDRDEEFAGEYLYRYTDGTPRWNMPHGARSEHSQILEDHHNAKVTSLQSLAETFNCVDAGMVNASSDRPFETDVGGLLKGDSSHGRLSCSELCNAVVMKGPELARSRSSRHVVTQEGTSFIDFDLRSDEEEVDVACRRASPRAALPLKVPTAFKRYNHDCLLDNGRSPSAEQQVVLRDIVKPFMRDMLTGALMKLRIGGEAEAANGSSAKIAEQDVEVEVSLSGDLASLVITGKDSGVERSVCIRSIRKVRPEETRSTSRGGFCVTLRLSEGRFLCFSFDTEEQCSYFGVCMRLLARAARSSMDGRELTEEPP